MYYQIKSYLIFLYKSTNAHGIHSPFVYDLVTKCFYDKKHYSEYNALQQYRKEVLSCKDHIEITDFGEGSRVFKTNKRSISDIAKQAGISKKRQQLLFKIIRYFKPSNSLELGTSLGLATSAIALGNASGKVTTVEGCPNTAKIASSLFARYRLKNIELETRTFNDFFNKNISEKYDFVYIDGNHNKEKTLLYFNELLKHSNNNTLFVFDDIYWSPKMTEAWKEICNHSKVKISIDAFFWGLVFLRKEQTKQHFTIRM
jgi:predicted O-methyltransferase YrrM